jgi:ABC-type phosphonate transport system ATPase subunit
MRGSSGRLFWIANGVKAKRRKREEEAMGTLSDSERKRITETIRSMVQKHAEASVSSGSSAICHNCGHVRPLTGSVHYGRYRLCNDCALSYELAKAQGNVQNVEDFVLAE